MVLQTKQTLNPKIVNLGTTFKSQSKWCCRQTRKRGSLMATISQKVLFLVTFYSKHTMAMTFENLCQASSSSFMS
jgi:hypothetical protein